MFSERTLLDRTPNPLALALEQRRAAGLEVLDLTVSNPTCAHLPYPAEAIVRALARPEAVLYEPQAFGLPAAREAVAAELCVNPRRLVLTASTSEAYAFLFRVLCDPGDEVLVPEPSYPLFEHLCRFDCVRPVPYRLRYDGEWYVDVGSVREAVGPHTRAVLAVSPNNPTGCYLKQAELDMLVESGLPLIVDEVFATYPLSEVPGRADVRASDRGLVLSLGGLSKAAGLPQMKLGWIHAHGDHARVRELLARLEIVADAFLSVATPVQLATPELLRITRPVHRAIRERTRTNLTCLESSVRGSALTTLRVEGGWYAVVRLPGTRTEEEWALSLLERGALIQPGWFYDFPDEPYAILSLLTPPDEFRRGIVQLIELAGAG